MYARARARAPSYCIGMVLLQSWMCIVVTFFFVFSTHAHTLTHTLTDIQLETWSISISFDIYNLWKWSFVSVGDMCILYLHQVRVNCAYSDQIMVIPYFPLSSVCTVFLRYSFVFIYRQSSSNGHEQNQNKGKIQINRSSLFAIYGSVHIGFGNFDAPFLGVQFIHKCLSMCVYVCARCRSLARELLDVHLFKLWVCSLFLFSTSFSSTYNILFLCVFRFVIPMAVCVCAYGVCMQLLSLAFHSKHLFGLP